MSSRHFQKGDRVIDYWERRYFGPKIYRDASVGTVLENYDGKCRINWTHGPKAGKITYMKHVISYDETVKERQTTLGGWNKDFDEFCMATNKEQK